MSGILQSLFGKKEEELAPAAPVSGAETAAATPEPGAEPVHVTDESFEELVLNSSLPVLVDFWAPWCGPCRMIAPIVEDLAKDYDGRAVIAKVNTDENAAVAGSLGIMGIPTLILFKDGAEVDRIVGFSPRKVFEDKLNKVV
jgi:thioredoxin 1